MHPNEELIRIAAEGAARGDMETWSSKVADDVLVHLWGGGEFKGKGELVDGFFAKMTPGSFRLEVRDVLGSDDHAIGLYGMSGERNGQSLDWFHVNVYRIEDGKVVEIWFMPFEQQEVAELLGV